MQEDTLHVLVVVVVMGRNADRNYWRCDSRGGRWIVQGFVGVVVLMVVGVGVGMAVGVPVRVSMIMAVMRMAKGCQTDNVDEESQNADYEQFIQALQLSSFCESSKCVEDYFNAHKPTTNIRKFACSREKRLTYMRNIPFAKPDRVSILP